jgi:8-oxo-dGTP pyrophosphatase MutT (NUDIX family)
VVPLRDHDGGIEVLMLRKNSKLAYGGMWVFPGGRVDPEDGDPLRDGEGVVAKRAAAREAMEEAALVVEPSSLVAFSHWTPPPQAPKRFLTWFFLAPARDAFDVVIDGGEIHEHLWTSPAEMIRRRDAGEVELAPPTWMTLRRLVASDTVDAALAAAAAREPERFETRVVPSDGALLMIWQGDAGWESGDPETPGPRHRLVAGKERWEYVGTA